MRVRITISALLLAALSVLAPPGARPASAHAGARAQLYVASAHLVPTTTGWSFEAVLRDLDSGQPEPGFAVGVKGSGPGGASFRSVTLTDPANVGRYGGLLPVQEGQWTLTVEAGELPGGSTALPYNRSWAVTVKPGAPIDLVGSGSGHRTGKSGSGPAPVLMAVAGAAALVGLCGLWLGCHRRTAVAAR
jgi:hypothetical protein